MKTNFLLQSRAITLYLFAKIYQSAIPGHSFPISTLIASLKNIVKGMPKIESGNQFLTSIKGRNSVLICQNLPVCNPRGQDTPSQNTLIASLKKIGTGMPRIESENDALKDGRTDTQTQFFGWRVYHNTLHFLKWRGIKIIFLFLNQKSTVSMRRLKHMLQIMGKKIFTILL